MLCVAWFDLFFLLLMPSSFVVLVCLLQDNECGLLRYTVAVSSDAQRRIAQHPLNRVFACTNCTAPGGNFFVVDQYNNIPWFVNTLMQAVRELPAQGQ
jgi:hypothetical protein